jgi:hypothetical protein
MKSLQSRSVHATDFANVDVEVVMDLFCSVRSEQFNREGHLNHKASFKELQTR